LVEDEIVSVMRTCDLCIANLECCISTRGRPWPAPGKPFFFRAPPAAVELLSHLGTSCVTLANNHALDYGVEALLDTFEHLDAAGIAWVGAGADLNAARAPRVLEDGDERIAVIAFADHPADFAAGDGRPGIAYGDLAGHGLPSWIEDAIGFAHAESDAVLVTPHWGPNMVAEPLARVRDAATELLKRGATLVAGHSAHVFQGAADRVLFDLGDFIDDYAVEPALRNDLGLLWIVGLDRGELTGVEALPLKLDYCRTRLATGEDARWIGTRLGNACRALGTTVSWDDGRLVIDY
jgi:poly-gamma-glutamate synthesis protein (capsule biosynthesis protein)